MIEGDECVMYFTLDEKLLNKNEKIQDTTQQFAHIILEIFDIYNNPYYYMLTYSQFNNEGKLYYSLIECQEIDKTEVEKKTNE